MKRLLPLLFAPLVALAAETPPAPSAAMSIERLDPALDALISPDAVVQKIAGGYRWSEGPVWFLDSIVFSDVKENAVYQWAPDFPEPVKFLEPSGMMEWREGIREAGSNGLAVNADNCLVLCQQGERRVARLEKSGEFTTLADRFEGKRFNSPNDLAIRKNGDIYFTDPSFGLSKLNDSPLKELAWNGVYRLAEGGKISLLIKDVPFPNGIAFSPDEKILYLGATGTEQRQIMAYDVKGDGGLEKGRIFFDATPLKLGQNTGSCDGLKVDRQGNLWASGPGGVLVISPAGKHLGTIHTGGGRATNCNWGDDGSTLYITTGESLLRVKTLVKGATW